MRMLVLAVLVCIGCVVGCGNGNDNRDPAGMRTPAPTPSPARTDLVLDGVYDATVVRAGTTSDSIGTVASNDDGTVSVSVALGNDAGASVTGNVTASGQMVGTG